MEAVPPGVSVAVSAVSQAVLLIGLKLGWTVPSQWPVLEVNKTIIGDFVPHHALDGLKLGWTVPSQWSVLEVNKTIGDFVPHHALDGVKLGWTMPSQWSVLEVNKATIGDFVPHHALDWSEAGLDDAFSVALEMNKAITDDVFCIIVVCGR